MMTFSTEAPVDPDAAASLAHVMLESEIQARIAAVRELAKQRKAIHEALAAYEEGWNAAVKEGWTVEQLQQIGLKEAPFEMAADARPAVEAIAPYAAPVAISTEYRSDASTTPSYDTPTFGGPVAVPFNG